MLKTKESEDVQMMKMIKRMKRNAFKRAVCALLVCVHVLAFGSMVQTDTQCAITDPPRGFVFDCKEG